VNPLDHLELDTELWIGLEQKEKENKIGTKLTRLSEFDSQGAEFAKPQ